MLTDPDVVVQVSDELQAYVYMLVDPRTGVPFYVGKGHGVRHAAHLADALHPIDDDADGAEQRSRKIAHIRELVALGLEPEVWILRHGLTVQEYTAVEAATIDLLMSFTVTPRADDAGQLPLGTARQLTNSRREQARGHGVRLLSSIVEEYAAPMLETEHPLLLITLNGEHHDPDGGAPIRGRVRSFAGYRPEWRESTVRIRAYDEIGESVCGWWSVSVPRIEASGIRHVVAVHQGVTRALFEIVPDSWEYLTTSSETGRQRTSVAFGVQAVSSGALFDEVVGPHGHRTPFKGTQNAVRYWPLR